ncbi:MAG: prepilin-type N-terminal cleavage/methylation domain-containing protein [Bacilli bacterium]|nr:prepilin-type N-terminal cleavage/methylation domain-containing protein [Bacilli bacterium]
MFKKRNGFTLVELLAVIVILAIILAIAVPAISGITKKAREDSLAASIKLMIKGIDYAILQGSTVTYGSAVSPAPYGESASDISTITIAAATTPTTITAVAVNATGKFAGCTVTGSSTYTTLGTIACTN